MGLGETVGRVCMQRSPPNAPLGITSKQKQTPKGVSGVIVPGDRYDTTHSSQVSSSPPVLSPQQRHLEQPRATEMDRGALTP